MPGELYGDVRRVIFREGIVGGREPDPCARLQVSTCRGCDLCHPG